MNESVLERWLREKTIDSKENLLSRLKGALNVMSLCLSNSINSEKLREVDHGTAPNCSH